MDAPLVLDCSALPEVSPELTPGERWYAAHMLARERALTTIFGESEPPGVILTPADPELQNNWPGGGIYQFPPAGKRVGWHYVTHGLAQPFSEEQAEQTASMPDAASGLGLELLMSATSSNVWAPNLLLELVRYLHFEENAQVFRPWERIPYSGFQAVGQTCLSHLMAVVSGEYVTEIRLPAGFCTLVHMVGITAAEIDRARTCGGGPEGSIVLARVLHELGVGQLTSPERACTTEHPLFDEVWAETAAKVREELAAGDSVG
jgi:hypothetical protein